MSKEAGIYAEEHFKSVLFDNKLEYLFINSWYDFEVLGQKVEIKSTIPVIKHGHHNDRKTKTQKYQVGMFRFKKDNLERMIKEKIWICFILRINTVYVILGFLKANKNIKKKFSLCQLRDSKPISFEEWKNCLIK